MKKNNRRQEGSYFLINLAVTDILKSIFCLPMIVVSSFYGEWVFDQIGNYYFRLKNLFLNLKIFTLKLIGCDLYGVLGGLFGFTSLATLAVMSLERYLIVSDPLRIFTFDKRFKIGKIHFYI